MKKNQLNVNEHVSLSNIDLEEQSQNTIPIVKGDIEDYTKHIRSEIIKNTEHRKFKYKELSTQVVSLIVESFKMKHDNNIFLKNVEVINKRLIEKEIEIQHGTIKVRKGGIIQMLKEHDNHFAYYIAKIDMSKFIDESDFRAHVGLPYNKKSQKTVVFKFKKDGKEPFEISVRDTNSTISKYWWHHFLELEEIITDTKNTNDTLKLYKKELVKLSKEYPEDAFYLENKVIGYYNSSPTYNHDQFIENLFSNYKSSSPNFPIDDVKEKFNSIIKDSEYDTQFIIKNTKSKYLESEFKLNNSISIKIKDHVPMLENMIIFDKDQDTNEDIIILKNLNKTQIEKLKNSIK